MTPCVFGTLGPGVEPTFTCPFTGILTGVLACSGNASVVEGAVSLFAGSLPLARVPIASPGHVGVPVRARVAGGQILTIIGTASAGIAGAVFSGTLER